MKRKRYTPPEKPHELDILKMLTPPAQYEAIIAGMMGEEGDHFVELIDRVLHDAQAVQVGMHHHVGDVAVHEHFARRHADDLVGRHARIRAADPQILGVLLP